MRRTRILSGLIVLTISFIAFQVNAHRKAGLSCVEVLRPAFAQLHPSIPPDSANSPGESSSFYFGPGSTMGMIAPPGDELALWKSQIFQGADVVSGLTSVTSFPDTQVAFLATQDLIVSTDTGDQQRLLLLQWGGPEPGAGRALAFEVPLTTNGQAGPVTAEREVTLLGRVLGTPRFEVTVEFR